jgi:hypothetical protein
MKVSETDNVFSFMDDTGNVLMQTKAGGTVLKVVYWDESRCQHQPPSWFPCEAAVKSWFKEFGR